MKKMLLILLLALFMVLMANMSLAEEKKVKVPDFSMLSTFTYDETNEEQFFSCMWAGMLVRKNVTVAGYLSAIDSIGLKYLNQERLVYNSGAIVTIIEFSDLLFLNLNGDPVQSAEILLYTDPQDKNLGGAQIPIDLDNNYLTTVLGKIEK